MAFSVIRGGMEVTLRLLHEQVRAYLRGGYSLEPSGFENRLSQRQDTPVLASVLITCSSCLLFQFSGIEACSFLPNR